MKVFILNPENGDKIELGNFTCIRLEYEDGERFYESTLVSAALLKMIHIHAPIPLPIDIRIRPTILKSWGGKLDVPKFLCPECQKKWESQGSLGDPDTSQELVSLLDRDFRMS